MSAVLKKFSEIKKLLPRDSLVVWSDKHKELSSVEFDNEVVLFIEGNCTLDYLDLDQPLSAFPECSSDEQVYLIYVQGNFTAKNIYNEETDHSCNLIVGGDLMAQNIVVGGQEIYISGNLFVKELFWGHYNHGDLTVTGNINAGVLLVTEEYGDFRGFSERDGVALKIFLEDDYQHSIERIQLTTIFLQKCLLGEGELEDEEAHSWSDYISRREILKRLAIGQSALKKNFRLYGSLKTYFPFVFEDKVIDSKKLLRLCTSPLFKDNFAIVETGNDINVHEISFSVRGVDIHVTAFSEAPFCRSVYFRKENAVIQIQYEKEYGEHDVAIFCGKFSKGRPIQLSLFDPGLPEHEEFKLLIPRLWENLLTEWSELEYKYEDFKKVVTREKIEQILESPLVKENYGKPDDIMSFAGLQIQFRQRGEHDPRITIIRYTGDNEYCHYHFEIKKIQNGDLGVFLYTQDGSGRDAETYRVNRTDILITYLMAPKLFQEIYKRICQAYY